MKKTTTPNTPIICVDHLVSGKSFELVCNSEQDMLITTPQPEVHEMQKFYTSATYISHTDQRKTIIDKLYHSVRHVRLTTKTNRLSKLFPQKGTLLDVGAGTGHFISKCQSLGWNALGIEPSSIAQQSGHKKGVTYIDSTKELGNGTVQCITLWHVLEHLPNLNETLKELYRILHSDGKIIVAVPNYLSWDAKHYQSHWAAFDVPRHLWHFSPKAIQRIFFEAGFDLENQRPMYWDALYISILSEKIKQNKWPIITGFFKGLYSNVVSIRTGMSSSLSYELKKRV
jgi:2-polyprenyl-3-methyl-5-hydroxy-6-metoxy-1,4-benzoquinol methylase